MLSRVSGQDTRRIWLAARRVETNGEREGRARKPGGSEKHPEAPLVGRRISSHSKSEGTAASVGMGTSKAEFFFRTGMTGPGGVGVGGRGGGGEDFLPDFFLLFFFFFFRVLFTGVVSLAADSATLSGFGVGCLAATTLSSTEAGSTTSTFWPSGMDATVDIFSGSITCALATGFWSSAARFCCSYLHCSTHQGSIGAGTGG
ncbi:hypothetical protein N7507_007182 [Penicillium longicatenatum]|nr:hypothetical protein N7507_007182 [Penicillium longicatenatum]